MPRSIVVTASFALLCFFLACVILQLGPQLALVGTVLALWSAVALLVWRRKSKYSLEALRELHLTGGPPPAHEDPADVPDDAGVVCVCCGNVYAAWMLVCPRCKRSG
jgi:hypothetical protein